MENTLFLQSEVQNPYEMYMRMLADSPVYFDKKNDIVAVYGYDLCKQILTAPAAIIPQVKEENGLNETALLIKKHLVRISNASAHVAARKAAMEIFNSMQAVSIPGILDDLLRGETEWVNDVCKKLPALYLLKSFQFDEAACGFFLQHTEALTKIMLPQRSEAQNNHINHIAPEVYNLISAHLLQSRVFRSLHSLQQDNSLLPWYVSNLAGLLIQGYDAGRGLLSNALLQVFCNRKSIAMDNQQCLLNAVIETLRFDPPVQNTRRVLVEDLSLHGMQLAKGQTILVVLAAANRDAAIFHQPHTFNIHRHNNAAHLGFGVGAHACLASHWAANMTAEALIYLFSKFSNIMLATEPIQYEPLVNVRMPKAIYLDRVL
jgi:cytochrome P450